MPVPSIRVQCAIAGGGPAGMMLGLLLARAGVKVVVLEKHADFIRDFRGDTIHPSTLDCMAEIGLLDDLLKLPHYEAPRLYGQVGDFRLTMADFSHLATRCKFIALMPQWDFLNFLSARARAFAAFDLRMETAAIGLLHDGARVTGLRARSAAGDYDIAADLVVAADGRHSTMRTAAGLTAHDIGAPMDVLWFKLSRKTSDPPEIFGRFEPGEVFIQINRGDHWQCGYVIAKGGYAALQARGIEAFRARIVALSPGMTDRTDEIVDWKDTSVLSVAVDRLDEWHRDGLLCIGDSAHAMSPVGGVGINLAIQDAVAAANRLAVPLRAGRATRADLAAVQARRMFPVRVTQALQVTIQNRVVAATLTARQSLSPPLIARLIKAVPMLARIPARIVGMGVRPEHVRSPVA